MTESALHEGDFVWCAFPERETPLRPGPLHVAYTLGLNQVGDRMGVMVAFTTSQPWQGKPPPGVLCFDTAEAASLGQTRAFVLDLRRLAFVDLAPQWFPRIREPGAGVLGRAPRALRLRVTATLSEIVRRHSENISRSGPFWPPGD